MRLCHPPKHAKASSETNGGLSQWAASLVSPSLLYIAPFVCVGMVPAAHV